MRPPAPDVVVLDPAWPTRALLRAQLIEEGYDVVATDAWPIPREYLRSGRRPRAFVVDLDGLPNPRNVLDEVCSVIAPNRVVVVTAIGTMEIDEIREMGFRAIARPTSVSDIVAAVAAILGP
ncbi:MAG TPA: hypothetical protein VIK60_07950 [Vicinamibacterales bacterium]